MKKYKNKQNFRKNIMKSKFLIILFSLILISTISAYQISDFGDYIQGKEIRLSQVCENAEFINITSIAYPNSSLAVEDIRMNESNNGEFFYNFNKTKTLGTYQVRGVSDGCEKNFAYTFDVIERDKGIFDFDFGKTYNIIIYIILLGVGIGMYFLGKTEITSVTFIIAGFLMLVNDINLIVSFIVIAVGIIVLFLQGRDE